jgi:glutathione S-transferase
MVALAAQGTPAWQGALMRPLLRVAEAYVRFRLDIDASTVQTGLQRVREVFARVDTELSDGRRFLTGDRFTAADLTFAALSSFVLMPAQYGVRLLELGELPEDMRRTVDSFRETRSGRFALALYEQERN